MATAQLTSSWVPENFVDTTLSSDITASDTDIFLANVPTQSEGTLVINPDSATSREIIYYNSKTATKVVCPSAALGRGYDNTTATSHTQGTRVIMAPVSDWFRVLMANINTGNTNLTTRIDETVFDHVASGLVWSGDAYGSTLAASMTAGVIYINGTRTAVSAVTARAFTASKDTYVDVGTDGVLDYTEVANNAASPALAADHIRVAIIVTGASNIANVGSVNQGQQDKVLPIASSIPYQVTDSLGNLICPRDPQRRIIGYRQITSNATATTLTDITGLNLNCIIPSGRKVRISGWIGAATASVTNNAVSMVLIDVTNSNAILVATQNSTNASGDSVNVNPSKIDTPTAGTRNYKAQLNRGTNPATANTNSATTNPSYIMVELL